MSIDSGILEEFSIEASELLDEAEDALLKIDSADDLKKIYDLVFRAFHSLKGSSGMIGFEELQRHLHILEDYLQKSKTDLVRFKDSTDYYLRGIDAARKILSGEVVQFVYEVYSAAPTQEVIDLKKFKILYLSNSNIKPLGEHFIALQNKYDFLIKFIEVDQNNDKQLRNEEYDILVSDLPITTMSKMIPDIKRKLPFIFIAEQVTEENDLSFIYQYLSSKNTKIDVYFAIKNALEYRQSLELFEKAKGIIMYMYSDLDEYLIKMNKQDVQKSLSLEVRNFLKKYAK